jgi:hypothetical protein
MALHLPPTLSPSAPIALCAFACPPWWPTVRDPGSLVTWEPAETSTIGWEREMGRPSQLNPIIVEAGEFLGTVGVQELGLAAERRASFYPPSIFRMTPRACLVHATCGRQSARSRAGHHTLAGLSHSLHQHAPSPPRELARPCPNADA